jgi:glycerol-3-phosphate O-acyltransferase 3/4
MLEHVRDPTATPLLVFPEGTCVNNEYTVMFKRGAFDLGVTVCPVAIKYNKIFVDAFWNSRRQAFTTYIVCFFLLFWLLVICVCNHDCDGLSGQVLS